jgi:hypothetical protein
MDTVLILVVVIRLRPLGESVLGRRHANNNSLSAQIIHVPPNDDPLRKEDQL